MSKKQQTKEEFLRELRRHLRKLPKEEIDSAVLFYQEYLEDSEGDIERTLASLGSAREVAAQIMANRISSSIEDSPPSTKKGFSVLWIVILGIFASPIALPLAIALVAVVIALFVVLIMLVVSLLVTIFCIIAAVCAVCVVGILGGIAYICIGIFIAFQNPTSALFYFGTGLSAAGLGIMLLPLVYFLAGKAWRFTAELLGHRLPRFVARVFSKRGLEK